MGRRRIGVARATWKWMLITSRPYLPHISPTSPLYLPHLEVDVHVVPLDLLEHALLVVVRADAGEGLDLLALVVLAEHRRELLPGQG